MPDHLKILILICLNLYLVAFVWIYFENTKIRGHTLIQANWFYIRQSIPMIHDYYMAEIGSERKTGSTKALGKLARKDCVYFDTVDIDSTASLRAGITLHKLQFLAWSTKCMDGKEYIADQAPESIAVFYLDAVDLEEKHSQKWHYEISRDAINKIVPAGFMCFDDTWKYHGAWLGKGRIAVPFLLSQGWEIVSYVPRAVLLQKPTAFKLPKYSKWAFWLYYIKYRYIKKYL